MKCLYGDDHIDLRKIRRSPLDDIVEKNSLIIQTMKENYAYSNILEEIEEHNFN